MSSANSLDYYHNSSRGRTGDGQSLPPLRSVLGDQLDLPFIQRGYQSPYDLGEISKALPPASGGVSDYRNTHRSTTMNTPHTSSRHGHEQIHSQRPYTYPPSVAPVHASRQPRPMTPSRDDIYHESSSSSHTTSSSRSGTSKKYACTWEGCDKRFERQHALDTHMNIHLEQKPFACPVPYCGKVFNVRSNMRRHLLTHKDVHFDGQFANEDDAEEDERRNGYFHRSRHDTSPDTRRHPPEHRTAAPAQSYYSSGRRA